MREIPSVAGIGLRATQLGEELAPVFIDGASVIEAFVGSSAQTHGPSWSGSNAPESSPAAKQSTRGA